MSINLHEHLGSSVPFDELFDIANDYGIKTGTKSFREFEELMKIPNQKIKHTDYLNKFKITQDVQSSPMAIEKSIYYAIKNAYFSGLDILELRFNPALRNVSRRFDIDTIMHHASMGVKKGCLAYGIKAGLIIETDRTFDIKLAIKIAKKAAEFNKHYPNVIVGFDVSGFSPDGFTIASLEPAFDIVNSNGLGITVHAGEKKDHSYQEVIDAIKILGADRVGHGIRIVDNEKTMEFVAKSDVLLELCPTSNIVTNCVADDREMATIIEKIDSFGVKWNLNTDGSMFLDTTVEKEHDRMGKAGLSPKMLAKSNAYAESATFVK